jgi:uncharacterized linocin/CFP29 family protein
MARGTFHPMGTPGRRDPIAEQQRAQIDQEKAAAYKARVIGRRIRVVADLDHGREGAIVDVADGMLVVRVDGEPDEHFFHRFELEAAR